MKKLFYIVFLISCSIHSQEKLNVYFDFDKSELNGDAVRKINSWIAEGKEYQVVKLYGFCDWKGTNEYNDTLALKRVNEVYDFLLKSKIDVKNDIEIRGFGKNFDQSKIQGENRRVTIIFKEKKEVVVEKTNQEKLNDQFKNSKIGDLIKLPTIYFYNNSAKIISKSQPILYDLLCVLTDNPNLKIEIQGHICCKLPSEYEGVSTARAKAIYNFLILNKIDRKRLSFKGYGVTKPIHPIPERNAQEEEENRRVEVLIIEN